ncbi:hypothetical protein [Candidatus Pelagibacter communis]|uniref:hypothetical protein n=1 Tax=Candidatus Pelagibacter TaxID=198251 RepID=UPI003EE225C7
MKYKNFILFILIPSVFSLLLIYYSLYDDLWRNFWGFFKIPSQLPPFSDLDAIVRSLRSKNEGLDPYFNNPYDTKQVLYVYTWLWLDIFEIFELDNKFNFKLFNFILIYLYVFIYFKLNQTINSKIYSIFLFLSFFSTSSLLLLERLNIDITIFILVFFLSISKNLYLKLSLFFLSIFLKLYPIFTVFVFLKNKKLFYKIIITSILCLIMIKDQIYLIMKNSIEYALLIVHGVPSIIKGLSYYAIKFKFIITENNYEYFKYLSIFLAILLLVSIFIYNFKFGKKKIHSDLTFEERLFLCGGGIYIGRMLFFSNWDYGLVFLIFTIPYLLNEAKKYKHTIIVLILICMNSIYFEGGNRYTLLYASKAFIIHSIKCFILLYITYYFSKIINSHFEINKTKLLR